MASPPVDVFESYAVPNMPYWRYKRLPPLPSPQSDDSYRTSLDHAHHSLKFPESSGSTPQNDMQTPQPQVLSSRPRMSEAVVHEILHRIGQAFSHIPYAVCGTAAMTAYSFTTRLPTHVCIACPGYTREVLKCWAATSGMATYADDPDAIGITVASGDTWKLRVTYLAREEDHRFDRMETVNILFGVDETVATRVLTMPALINQLAMAYNVSEDERLRRSIAGDIMWLLEAICRLDDPHQFLTWARLPDVKGEPFWLDFTTTYPHAAGLFYDAGLRTEQDLERDDMTQVSMFPHLGQEGVGDNMNEESLAGGQFWGDLGIGPESDFAPESGRWDGPISTYAEEENNEAWRVAPRRKRPDGETRSSRTFSFTRAFGHMLGGRRNSGNPGL